MEIFVGESKISTKSNIRFSELKLLILNSKKIMAKYFISGEKINECMMVKNFPSFDIMIDPNEFIEHKRGQYLCKFCRKYLKISKWVCSHTPICY